MDNRQLIMNSALTLFYESGYDAVGVQQIVDSAGVSKPTLYYYFGSKQGLLEALLNEHFQPMEQMHLPQAELLFFLLYFWKKLWQNRQASHCIFQSISELF